VFVATSVFLVVLAIATLGADTGMVRFVAVRLEQQPTEIGSVISVILAPVIVLATLLGIGAYLLTPVLLDDTSWADQIPVFQLLAVFLPVAAVSVLVLSATRGLGTVRPTVIVEGLIRQGLQPVLALAAGLAGLGPFWLAAAWIVPYAVALVVGAVIFRRLCAERGIRAVAPWGSRSREIAREVWLFNAPRSLTQIAQMAVRRSDVALVGFLAGKPAASIYMAASRFVAAGLQGIKGIQQMVGPQIARLVAAGQPDQAGLTLRTATTWNVLIAWPIYLTCAAAPALIMSIFGRGYTTGTTVVVILALAMLVGTAAGPVDIALLMVGRSVQSLVNNMAALIVNLGLNIALIPTMGINGAAIAWAAAIVVSNALPTWQIRKILGSPSDRATLTAALIALGTFGLLPLTARLVFGDHTWTVLGSLALAAACYVLVVLRLRKQLRVNELLSTLRRRGRGKGRAKLAPAAAAETGD
ncbi:MAG: oligosaccharide flippase family protein, partial [Nocardioides sp.]